MENTLEAIVGSAIAESDAKQNAGAKGHEMLVPVVEGQPLYSGVKTLTGSLPVRVLLERYKIPYRDALRKTGYQRKPQETRVNRFAAELKKKRVDVPTSILINIRGQKARECLRKDGGQLYLDLNNNNRDEFPIYIVDGQHRVLAFERLCEDDLERWGKYQLQFVLMLGAQEDEEVNQFYVVNTTAKSVRTDLALDLLKQRAEADGRVMEEVIERGQDWKVEGQAIVEELFRSSPVWRGKIRLANADKGDTIIPAASFVSSLKPLLISSPFCATLSRVQRVKLLDAYWQGIREALREPFDGNPNEYALQKGIGVTAMHDLLVNVVEHVRSAGESVFDERAYFRVMEPILAGLDGDNTAGENVSGADFWLTAPLGGAAGSYSSSAGKRVLLAKLRSALPALEVE